VAYATRVVDEQGVDEHSQTRSHRDQHDGMREENHLIEEGGFDYHGGHDPSELPFATAHSFQYTGQQRPPEPTFQYPPAPKPGDLYLNTV